MYKNKGKNGKNNLCGEKIRRLREAMDGHPSQRAFADMLQRAGLDADKNAVSRIEGGQRLVTDIKLQIIARVLKADYRELLDRPSDNASEADDS